MKDRTEGTETRDQGRVRDKEQGSCSSNGSPDAERSTSWISVVSGWLAALGASLIVGGVLGGLILVGVGSEAATERSEIVRLIVTLMVAFLIGGYVAGRMAGRLGLKHGILVALLFLVSTGSLVLVGEVAGISLTDNLNGVTLPNQRDLSQNLDVLLSASGALVLLLPFVGGAFGGAWGAKDGRKRP